MIQKLLWILKFCIQKFYKKELNIFFQIFPRQWFFFHVSVLFFSNFDFLRFPYGLTGINICLKLHIIEDITKGNNWAQADFWNSNYKLSFISLEIWKSLKKWRKKNRVFPQNTQYLSHNNGIIIVWAHWFLSYWIKKIEFQ